MPINTIAVIMAASLTASAPTSAVASPEEVVRGFLRDVRSGVDPDAAASYFAPEVDAHQVTSEETTIIRRTPAEYAEHIREFRRLFGPYTIEVEELIVGGDRVYARWRQAGHHFGSLAGEEPTGRPLTDIGSAVYRVSDGRIAEYWIQTDRKGLELQLTPAAPSSR